MPVIFCDCCGLQILQVPPAGNCPRCGYPVDSDKETLFLQTSIHDLQRVSTHGGARLSVAELLSRYRTRLTHLQQLKQTRPATVSIPEPDLAVLTEKVILPEQVERVFPAVPLPEQKHAEDVPPAGVVTAVAVTPEPVAPPDKPAKSFSWRSLLEDQTINILASLGAFLLLVGSLSFVTTTTDLALSFFSMFAVHALFGITGAICYRWQSFRLVAIIYTAIFALLVPLVGFSGYRLAVGQLIPLPTSALVALAAVYATIVYALLAIYQRFVLFSYLSIVACIVADLATTATLHLSYWWWPNTLGVLALPAVVSLSNASGGTQPLNGRLLVLRDALRWLVISCIGICGAGGLIIFSYTWGLDSSYQPWQEVRWALCVAMLLLVVWAALCVWRTKRAAYAQALPYLFLLFALSSVYAWQAQSIVYAVMLTGLACLYHLLNRTLARLLQPFQGLMQVNDILALILVGIVPFIVQPDFAIYVIGQAWGYTKYGMTATLVVGLISIIVGCGLVMSIVLSYTGLRRVPQASKAGWCWLLVLSGFLLNWAFAMVMCWLNVDLLWSFLGLALVFIAAMVVARRWLSAQWANPLDVLALSVVCQTLLLGSGRSMGHVIFLCFLFAALSYGVLLYQRRYTGLFITLLFALLAINPLLKFPHILYLTCLVFPLAAALLRRFVTNRWHAQNAIQSMEQRRTWEWPLVAIGICYGLILLTVDGSVQAGESIVEHWLHVTFPASLEVVLLALVWYGSAVLSRVRWWLVIAVACAFVGVAMSTHAFQTLVWLGPLLIVVGFVQSRIMSKAWAMPLYVTAIWTVVVMGIVGYNQPHVAVAVWALLIFALLIYFVGVWERINSFMWAAPLFATWSVYYAAGLLGDLYRPPLTALLCAALGVGIGCLSSFAPTFVQRWQMPHEKRRNRLLRYALPWYATALAAAILTGLYGSLGNINYPFYTAIPDALLLYACIAYAVALFERETIGQWLVVGFAVWATVLATQIATTPSHMQDVLFYLAGIVMCAGCLGLLTGRIFNERLKLVENTAATTPGASRLERFTWNWSWYVVTFVALAVTVLWSFFVHSIQFNQLVLAAFCLFIALTLLVMLVERVPELLVVAVILAVLAIARPEWLFWQRMIAYSLVCVLVFSAQFVWGLPSMPARGQQWHRLLGLGGQVCVVLAIIVSGGLVAESGVLAQVGIGALLVLAGLLFWHGRLQSQQANLHWCNYGAGVLIACAVSWELAALHQMEIDWLTLAPATYLIVIAPFLSRDQNIAAHRALGRYCSLAGAALLLLPTLWLSFSVNNWQPTLILGGEALALLFLGVLVRVRFFVLSGAALVIVTAIHVLFLPALGIPLSAALAIIGGLLLAVATALSLARHRLRSAWMQWQ